jgi:hypothetical protein
MEIKYVEGLLQAHANNTALPECRYQQEGNMLRGIMSKTHTHSPSTRITHFSLLYSSYIICTQCTAIS